MIAGVGTDNVDTTMERAMAVLAAMVVTGVVVALVVMVAVLAASLLIRELMQIPNKTNNNNKPKDKRHR